MIVPHPEYTTLSIDPAQGHVDREVGFLRECMSLSPSLKIVGTPAFDPPFEFVQSDISDFMWIVPTAFPDMEYIRQYIPIIYSSRFFQLDELYKHKYRLKDTTMWLYVPERLFHIFYNTFRYFLENNELVYDNLIHLCIMVKNAGDGFEDVLRQNLPFIDEWTILDTGSTDNTIPIIERVLKNKKGRLYQEPFVNFRDSRNRCLELAGVSCTFTIMLDDTYILKGNVREFLREIRGDMFGDSYSLFVKSNDVEYTSNRILRSNRYLRYMYKIHEVVQFENNKTVIVPKDRAWIDDAQSDYMQTRTNDRKQYDLQLLHEMIEEEPDVPRHLYYLAQTYNLLKNYEMAFEYFRKRVEHPVEGFAQEAVDSAFEMGRIAAFQLGREWSECEQLFKKAYALDPERPEAMYFLGIHYYLEREYTTAYAYMKKAFEIGYPAHRQFSLKPTLSFHFLPKFLAEVCYYENDFILGEKAALLYLQNNPPDETVQSWYVLHTTLQKLPPLSTPVKGADVCFIADGNWNEWNGNDLQTKGLGGSETYIAEMARHLVRLGFSVVVFCKCSSDEIVEGVLYKPISSVFGYLATRSVKHCIVSRFSQYIPVALKSHAENVYLVLHDLGPSGNIIPVHPKLKKIFCLSEWHVSHFLESFPQFTNITVPFHYGIDGIQAGKKVPNSFIYSSFPNRGLKQLLEMWPYVIKKYTDATLHIYSDVEGEWVNRHFPDEMNAIRLLLNQKGVVYHGWVSKKELAKAWETASVWLYPCTFRETFCLTALEAAKSKTLVVTNNLAALENTVGDRGLVVKGDPTTMEWQTAALRSLFELSEKEKERLIERNYAWACTRGWDARAAEFAGLYLT
jgi:tetratricopeptide (TPR) repeat protein